jgi:radical SAM superfamily enzyme YgiQ (UPF0313 family)
MGFRLLLIYPPEGAGESPLDPRRVSDADYLFFPYGLLTIAGDLRDQGIEVEVLNLICLSCEQAMAVVRRHPAEIIGLTCYTFQRHAAARLGEAIKREFPRSHVTVGGSHVTPMPQEWLNHYPAFDSVVVGEGEATMRELVAAVRDGRPTEGISGTAYRSDSQAILAPPRARLANLDVLGKPWRYYDYAALLTSRGCPAECTFCSSPSFWNRKVTFRSVENVMEEVEELVVRRGQRLLAIKDDTFTAHRGHVLAICQAVRERGLEFRWSCDSRIDYLNAEVLQAMRRAGCTRISVGIESGSPDLLQQMKKRLDLDRAEEITSQARNLGLPIRYFLIVGTPGETPEILRATAEFVKRARPTSYLATCHSTYPGTEDFFTAAKQGLLSLQDYFTCKDEFYMMRHFHGLSEAAQRELAELHPQRTVDCPVAPFTLEEREAVYARHADMLLNALDLVDLYITTGRLHDAERVLRDASLRIGRESSLVEQYLACLQCALGNVESARRRLNYAHARDPRDTLIQLQYWTVFRPEIGAIDPKSMAERMLANLRNAGTYLFLHDGKRNSVAPITAV